MKKQINEEFEKLHKFLQDEKAAMKMKLELEVRQKTESLEIKIVKIEQEILSLSNTIGDIKVELQSEDVKFLKVSVQFRSFFFYPLHCLVCVLVCGIGQD